MENEEIKKTQEEYNGLLKELDEVSAKMGEFGLVLTQMAEEFDKGNTVSVEVFGQMMRMAQDYYTIDMRLKSALPDTGAEDAFNVEEKKAMLNEKLEMLDRELVKNSVNSYFNLVIADAEKTEEMEESKETLHTILDAPEGIDMTAIRPYMSLLQLVDNPDVELSDELMDEMDDVFSKQFMRALLRGKVTHSHSVEGDDAAQAGHAQTLD